MRIYFWKSIYRNITLTVLFYFLGNEKYKALDGCSENNALDFEDEYSVGFYPGDLVLAQIVCCEDDGSGCSRKIGTKCRSEEKVTWEDARKHCEKDGKRLCNSQRELDQCCKTGCKADNLLVWTSENNVQGE